LKSGPFIRPNPLPEYCKVDYIDKETPQSLREQFFRPEAEQQLDSLKSERKVKRNDKMYIHHLKIINSRNIVHPSIIDDGEILSKIEDEQYDFLIANHMIEHTENFFFHTKSPQGS